MLTFIFNWISDYANTPVMEQTLSQKALFTAAMLIIGTAITAVCALITFIATKIMDR